MAACIGQNHRSFQKFSENSLLSYKQCYEGVPPRHQGIDSSYTTTNLYLKQSRNSPSEAKKEDYKNIRLQSNLFHEYKCNNPN